MKAQSQFRLSENQAGVGIRDFPSLVRVRQSFPRPVEADVEGAVRRELTPFLAGIKRGQKIAITGSSRGIANLPRIMKASVDLLRSAGADPFIVPAMGSHGGATAAGQVGVLANMGITESTVGCPIRSSMDVIQVGTTATGFPVFQDKIASEADGVLVINRVKPHTGFTERVESGICKMLVIGLGKQEGASKIHHQALRVDLGRMVLDASKMILESGQVRFIGALAVVENAFKETAVIQGLSLARHAELVAGENKLLLQAYDLLPRLPFTQMDGLIVDKIGKNISGSGMDTNVIGRKPGQTEPQIGVIYVRGLTEETHGNATGIGMADLMPRPLLEQIDFNATYMNSFTAKRLVGSKMPLMMEDEVTAVQVMMNFRADADPASARIVWIKNTLALDQLWASTAMLDDIRANSRLEVISPALPMTVDGEGSLIEPRVAL